jgi:hypothetical protein
MSAWRDTVELVGASDAADDAFEAALQSVDPLTCEVLRALVRDSSYVEPRVVSHLRD